MIKTQEVAQLQVGSNTNDVRILFSTLAEAEHLLDYLLNCHKAGKKANVRLSFSCERYPLLLPLNADKHEAGSLWNSHT